MNHKKPAQLKSDPKKSAQSLIERMSDENEERNAWLKEHGETTGEVVRLKVEDVLKDLTTSLATKVNMIDQLYNQLAFQTEVNRQMAEKAYPMYNTEGVKPIQSSPGYPQAPQQPTRPHW